MKHAAITITGGTSQSRDKHYLNVGKGKLLGDLAVALEQGQLAIAANLPLKDRILRELESFEVKITAAGNESLQSADTEAHSDLAIASALALYHSNNAPGKFSEAPIAGYWG